MPQQPLAQVPLDATWDWSEQGACRDADPNLFFHPQNERGAARIMRDRAAKAICAGCSVRTLCADYAVRAREPYGVWGGLTEEDREAIYRKLDSRNYPRARGEGLRAAEDEIERAVSATALGIA